MLRLFKLIELYDGKMSLNINDLSPQEQEYLLKLKEDMLDYQKKTFDEKEELRKKREQEKERLKSQPKNYSRMAQIKKEMSGIKEE